MRSSATRLSGAVLIEPAIHRDDRGFFAETYRDIELAELGMADVRFVQDNHSRSTLGVVRGMHFQIGAGMAKLVRCGRGAIVDVIVDLRRGSPTYRQWEAFRLDDETHRQLFVPVGFAHGFCVVSEVADVMYKQSGYYDPELERGIAYDDPDLGIEWPLPDDQLVPSPRDAQAPRLAEIADELPF